MPRPPKPRWHRTRRRWYACIGDPDATGRRREVYAPASVADEAGAWDWFRAERARREAEVSVPAAGGTVEWVCEHYLAWCERRVEEGKLPRPEYSNKVRHLTIVADSPLGARPATALGPDDATALGEGLMSLHSPTYARNIVATLRAALNWAVKAKLLPANPIKGYRAPTVPRSPVRFAERAEAAAFLAFWRTRGDRATARGRYDRLTLLMERCLIRTGARPGELCKLQWADLRWEGWRTSSGHVGAKAVIPPDRWKAGKATGKPRTIYFTPALARALRRVLDRGAPDPTWVFVHSGGRGGRGAGEPWPSGSALSKTVLRIRREAIAAGAALREAGRPDRGLGLIRDAGHDRLVNYRWRHTAISTLLMMGVDVATVAELTGTSPDMIYRHYGHILDSHLAGAAEKLAGRRRSGK